MGPLSTADVNAFLADAYPAAADQGVRCEEVGASTATARWVFDEGTLRPGGYISGPTIFIVCDSALWFATFTVIGIEAMAVTSEMSLRFLRPARGGDLLATATIASVGRRQLVGNVVAWVDGAPDRPVATAQGTYVRP